MPELPDVTAYAEAISARMVGRRLTGIRLNNPFLLRTVDPKPSELVGAEIVAVRRIGKRLAIGVEGDRWLVIHLMVAGRLHFKPAGAKIPGRIGLMAVDVPDGTLILTEAGTKRRASLHVVRGEALADFDRGGVDPLTITVETLSEVLRRERHTLKRTLTDPRLIDGVGGAYADEILFDAKLSPLAWSDTVDAAGVERLASALPRVLTAWTDRLREEAGGQFPKDVTAFHEGMAVHGRYGQPCRVCGTEVQRIVYAERETNYCPTCQTEGRVLRDRALSQLLKGDWPETIEQLEALKRW